MAPDYYAVLAVNPTATQAELRTAYLKLARAHHPDGFEGPERATAEARMQSINEAWNVLGVAHKRTEYDATNPRAAQPGSSGGPRRGRDHFVPFDDDEDLIDRSDVDYDPTPISGSKPLPRWITLMPMVLLFAGICWLGVGLLVSAANVIAFGMVILLLGGVGFLMMPLIVMSRAERDPNL